MIQTCCGSSSREIILPITQVQNILLLTLSLTNQTILSILPFQALAHVPIRPDFITPVIYIMPCGVCDYSEVTLRTEQATLSQTQVFFFFKYVPKLPVWNLLALGPYNNSKQLRV